jgi:hypothetical protein
MGGLWKCHINIQVSRIAQTIFDGICAEMLLKQTYQITQGFWNESWGLPKVVSSVTKFIWYCSARLHSVM